MRNHQLFPTLIIPPSWSCFGIIFLKQGLLPRTNAINHSVGEGPPLRQVTLLMLPHYGQSEIGRLVPKFAHACVTATLSPVSTSRIFLLLFRLTSFRVSVTFQLWRCFFISASLIFFYPARFALLRNDFCASPFRLCGGKSKTNKDFAINFLSVMYSLLF